MKRVILRRAGFVLAFIYACSFLYGQKRWDGEGGDGNWENATNWNDNIIPIASDDVILDNSFLATSFDVFLTGTGGAVTCRSITIVPSSSKTIRLVIPNTNTLPIALVTTGGGYSIQLKEGAILINASGASTGTILSIADSMKIENNARYIHRTPRGNAAILNTLSSSLGTERGIVEFDVPVVSGSYIVSLTNRIFGTLVFSSTTNNGPITYTSNGSNRVLIRGDMIINPQVSMSVGFNDTMHVKGDLVHSGNVFNLSNNGNPTVLQLDGNILVNIGSTITETNTAQPVILFSGPTNQQCSVQGNLLNEIVFKIQKTGLLFLSAPLMLPFNLEMKKGVFKTDSLNMLTLSTNSKILVDSLMGDSIYIDGPVRKLGLSADHFQFPVGKPSKMRWLELKNANGDFTVEFFKSNPYSLSTAMNGVNHISRIEYWSIQSSSPVASAVVELSFDNVNSGGVTDLSSLRVAQLNGSWTSQGNTGTTGSAGAAGSVRSDFISDFSAAHRFFSLASADVNQNPLPLRSIQLTSAINGNEVQFNWDINSRWTIDQFVLEYSTDRSKYQPFRNIDFDEREDHYRLRADAKSGWYRLSALSVEGIVQSNVVYVGLSNGLLQLECNSRMPSADLVVSIHSGFNGIINLELFNSAGQLSAIKQIQTRAGEQQFHWRIPGSFSKGVYYLVALYGEVRSNVIKLLK